jgi:hypothetical protein
MHPQLRVQKMESTQISSPQVHRIDPAFPARVVLTASFALSLVIGLCVTIPGAIAKAIVTALMPASRHQDHTTSPSACLCIRQPHRKRRPHPAQRS